MTLTIHKVSNITVRYLKIWYFFKHVFAELFFNKLLLGNFTFFFLIKEWKRISGTCFSEIKLGGRILSVVVAASGEPDLISIILYNTELAFLSDRFFMIWLAIIVFFRVAQTYENYSYKVEQHFKRALLSCSTH